MTSASCACSIRRRLQLCGASPPLPTHCHEVGAHCSHQSITHTHTHTHTHTSNRPISDPTDLYLFLKSSLSPGVRCSRDYPAAGGSSGPRRGRGGKRLKHQESSDPHSSLGMSGRRLDPRTSAAPLPLHVPHGPLTNSSSWPSVGSQAGIPSAPFAPGMLPIYPVYPPLARPLPIPDPSRFPPTQMVPPMMALVLPNYIFPTMGAPISQPGATPGHFYNPNFTYPSATPAIAPAIIPTVISGPLPIPGNCVPSRSSTPQSYNQTPVDHEGAESPLFQSRCSSPLNLLQLEETPSNRLEVASALAASQQATPSAQGGAAGRPSSANQRSSDDTSKENVSTTHVQYNLFFSYLWEDYGDWPVYSLIRGKLMSPTRMQCPRPATCWTCCCRRTPTQAPAQLLVQGSREPGPRVHAPAPTDAVPLAPAATVSR